MDHRTDWRSRVALALNDKGYDTACSTLAHAMEDGTLSGDEFASPRAARGWAAVLVGTPDYGQNDTETDCIDALTNVLHYAALSGCDVERVLRLAQGHFDAEQHDDDF